MTNNTKKNKNKNIRHKSVLESLKDIGGSTNKSLKKDLLSGASNEFVNQLFGRAPKKYSGDIEPGSNVEMKDIYSGQYQENQKLKKQVHFERTLRQEEEKRNVEKSNELRVQLQALIQEVQALAQTTQGLAQETKVAAMQAPIEPGVYHLIFFEKLLEFLKSFRQQIEDASLWLNSTNKRAAKKNYWAKYKKHGSKFLLSADHYLTRSAG